MKKIKTCVIDLSSKSAGHIARRNSRKKAAGIAHPQAKAILMKLENLIAEPPAGKMPTFFILGENTACVTPMVKEFSSKHPPSPASDDGFLERRLSIINIEAPIGPSEGKLYSLILDRLQVKYREYYPPDQKKSLIQTYFGVFKVDILIINNFHRALKGPVTRRSALINALKTIGHMCKIPIVVIGKKNIIDMFGTDIWISSEYLPVVLPDRDVGLPSRL